MTAQPRRMAGFTLVELLVVIVILGILIGLLVPVVIGAVNRANEARVSAEINSIASALASFKNKYGDYPPSRIILCEDGGYAPTPASATDFYGLGASRMNYVPDYLPIGGNTIVAGNGDILNSYVPLVNRSLRYMRKFFPRVNLSPNGASTVSGTGDGEFYDFNGNGNLDVDPILLEGHECLTFFLGGIPVHDSSSGSGRIVGVSGFGKNPVNPFVRDLAAGGQNRDQAFYDFKPNQLWDDDHDGIPGYVDTIGQSDQARYFAFFSGYNGTGFDPNDCNYDYLVTGENTGAFGRTFVLSFPVIGGTIPAPLPAVNGRTTESPLPNPYTTGPSFPVNGTSATFISDQSYQIISPGRDRLYGVGGRYTPDANADRLPDDAPIGVGDRIRDRDNLTSFSQGRME